MLVRILVIIGTEKSAGLNKDWRSRWSPYAMLERIQEASSLIYLMVSDVNSDERAAIIVGIISVELTKRLISLTSTASLRLNSCLIEVKTANCWISLSWSISKIFSNDEILSKTSVF